MIRDGLKTYKTCISNKVAGGCASVSWITHLSVFLLPFSFPTVPFPHQLLPLWQRCLAHKHLSHAALEADPLPSRIGLGIRFSHKPGKWPRHHEKWSSPAVPPAQKAKQGNEKKTIMEMKKNVSLITRSTRSRKLLNSLQKMMDEYELWSHVHPWYKRPFPWTSLQH